MGSFGASTLTVGSQASSAAQDAELAERMADEIRAITN